MATGGNGAYPSLNTIANLARSKVNDDKKGATGTAGEGQILTNSSITLQNLMNSAIRDTYRDVRIMGQPTLIADNYILLGLPPINSMLGVGVMNPAVQQALQFVGFFDGLTMDPDFLLPSNLLYPIEVWERPSGTDLPFGLMKQSSGALCPRNQVNALGSWEWRSDGIWFNGATQSRDIRLRYTFTFPDLAGSAIDWTTTYVPILDCQEAVADKIAVVYSRRLGGAAVAEAKEAAKESIFKLRQQINRDRQFIDYTRPSYGDSQGDAGNPATALY